MEWQVKTFDELTKQELYDILRMRSEVFVAEQSSPYNDVDGADFGARRVYARASGWRDFRDAVARARGRRASLPRTRARARYDGAGDCARARGVRGVRADDRRAGLFKGVLPLFRICRDFGALRRRGRAARRYEARASRRGPRLKRRTVDMRLELRGTGRA